MGVLVTLLHSQSSTPGKATMDWGSSPADHRYLKELLLLNWGRESFLFTFDNRETPWNVDMFVRGGVSF